MGALTKQKEPEHTCISKPLGNIWKGYNLFKICFYITVSKLDENESMICR